MMAVNRREDALFEGLLKNNHETIMWKKYKKDNKQAEGNLTNFSKKLEVSVMVPIGSKALMPGKLIHTNEILISHYQGIFSRSSVQEALKICAHRSKKAEEYLEKLKVEKDMFTNNLRVPHVVGALSDGNLIDLSEEYDKEKEKIWREKHRKSLQRLKEQEKMDLSDNKNYDETFENLINMELLDELEQDFDELGIQDDENLRKLLLGELKPLSKQKPISLNSKNISSDLVVENPKNITNKPITKEINCESKSELCLANVDIDSDDFDISDSDSDEDSYTPREVIELSKIAQDLKKVDKITLYEKNLKKYEDQIDSLKIRGVPDMEERLRLLEIREFILDHLEILYDIIDTDTEDEKENIPSESRNRRISFASDDQNCFFRTNDVVSDMLKNNEEIDNHKVERDVIKLDEEDVPHEMVNKKISVIDRVEKNLELTKKNECEDDYDLVSKIINQSSHQELSMQFQEHSQSETNVMETSDNLTEGTNDNDVCGQLNNEVEVQLQSGPEQLNNKIIPDSDMEYQTEPSLLKCDGNEKLSEITKNPNKSILKNKLQGEKSTQEVNTTKNRVNNKIDYQKILGDIVEKDVVGTEPLPKERFIDDHANKKKPSHFKQLRAKK